MNIPFHSLFFSLSLFTDLERSHKVKVVVNSAVVSSLFPIFCFRGTDYQKEVSFDEREKVSRKQEKG